jgi:hypothetical protein
MVSNYKIVSTIENILEMKVLPSKIVLDLNLVKITNYVLDLLLTILKLAKS